MTIVIFLHTFTQSLRHLFVLSGFGTISYCKHSPTCSEFALQQIKKQGLIKGTTAGIVRLLRCW